MRRLVVPILMCLMLIVGGAGIAAAHETLIASNGGSQAYAPHTSSFCSGTTTHPRVRIKDLAADGFSVASDYYRGTTGSLRVVETRGKNYYSWSRCGPKITKIRSCVVKPVLPDTCTNWQT